MNKNIIKAYSKNIKKEDIIKYANKEYTNISDNEVNIIYNEIHNNIDSILDGNALDIINSHKNEFSLEVYNLMIAKYEEYKKFIE